jgi:hypothetical protein
MTKHTSNTERYDIGEAAGALSSRAWKPSKNRAEVQHFCRLRGAIWANTASKRRLRRIDDLAILGAIAEKGVNASYTPSPQVE